MMTQVSSMPMQITRLELAADEVVAITLQAPDRLPLPTWSAGAHIDLVLPSGLVRQYSLCGDPGQTDAWRIAVLRDGRGRGGSREVHDALRLGQQLEVRGPRNAFALQAAPSYLFVAGGIGVTPLLPMLQAAVQAGADWHFVYGGRTRRSMAFIAALQALDDTPAATRVQVLPADEYGLLDLADIVARARAGAQVYSCGPAALLDALTSAFAEAGLGEQLHIERFAAVPLPAATPGSDGLTVRLAKRGIEVRVPDDISILTALRAAGCEVPSSCEQGICGMCETRVLDGVPEHRDMLLTDSEKQRGDVMMVCVSRACTSHLTLDL